MKKILLLTIILSFCGITIAQDLKRDPDSRKDFANVFYKTQYTLFDLWSDEPIFPEGGNYNIYYATNENKTPKQFKGSAQDLSKMTVYKFKNYSNCKNWFDGVKFNSQSQVVSQSSNSSNTNSNLVNSNNSLTNKADLKVNTPLLVFRRNTTNSYFTSNEKDVLNIVLRKNKLEEQIKSNELKLNQYFNLESGKIDHNDLNFKIEHFRNLRNADVYFIDKKSLVLKLLKLSTRSGFDIKHFAPCVISKNNVDTYTIFSKYQVEIGSKYYESRLVGYWQKNWVQKESNEKVVKLLVKNDISILDEKSKMEKIKLVTGLDDEYFVLTEAIKKDQTELDNIIKNSCQLIEGGYTYYGNFALQGIRQFGVLLNSNNDTLFIGNWIENLPDISNGKLYLYNNTDDATIINSNGSVFKTYEGGDVYIGQIEKGVKSGSGSYVWASGSIYTGEWENGENTGRGVKQYSSGNKYEGDFKQGNRNGMGKFTYANGRIEDGLFENNNFIKSRETIEQERIAENRRVEEERIAEAKRVEAEKIRQDKINEANAKAFWALIKQAGEQESNSNNSHNQQTQSSHSSACRDCGGSGECNKCSQQFKIRYMDNRCGSFEKTETKLGYIRCEECLGFGFKRTNLNCDCPGGIGWCYEKDCRCMDGWVYCKECNDMGKWGSPGKCKSCKGTGRK
jgi:hypothetical protein